MESDDASNGELLGVALAMLSLHQTTAQSGSTEHDAYAAASPSFADATAYASADAPASTYDASDVVIGKSLAAAARVSSAADILNNFARRTHDMVHEYDCLRANKYVMATALATIVISNHAHTTTDVVRTAMKLAMIKIVTAVIVNQDIGDIPKRMSIIRHEFLANAKADEPLVIEEFVYNEAIRRINTEFANTLDHYHDRVRLYYALEFFIWACARSED